MDNNVFILILSYIKKSKNTQKWELLDNAKTPSGIKNCFFGGEDLKTLCVTDRKYLPGIRTIIPGKPSYQSEL